MIAFFNCVERYVAHDDPATDYGLITDRLYKRYLRHDQLAPAEMLALRVAAKFGRVESAGVDWPAMGWTADDSRIDIAQPTLADVFAYYLESVHRVCDTAHDYMRYATKALGQAEVTRLGYLSSKVYIPVWTGVTEPNRDGEMFDLSWDELDALDGPPIWLREEGHPDSSITEQTYEEMIGDARIVLSTTRRRTPKPG